MSKLPPPLKNAELRAAERLLIELIDPAYVWKRAYATLEKPDAKNHASARVRRFNALNDVLELLAKHRFRLPRSTTGYHVGYTERGVVCHVTEDDRVTLCGFTIYRLVINDVTGDPLSYTSYLDGNGVSSDDICHRCFSILEKR